MSDQAVFAIFPEVNTAIKQGRMLDAWELVKSTGVAVQDWPEGDLSRQVARLVASLGGHRLSAAIHWKNWRKQRSDPERYYQALYSRIHKTPVVKLQWEVEGYLAKHPGLTPSHRADLLAFLGWTYMVQNDFKFAGMQTSAPGT